jgi:[acyl-carrier-protein] S-malonyltransferase
LPGTHTAFIFPAFANDYSDHPGQVLPGFEEHFTALLRVAAKAVDPPLSEFSFSGTTYLDDELRTQYLTYIYSCAASSILRKQGYAPSVSAGFSMGIYAALHDAGVISFVTGLELIRLAYISLRSSLRNKDYGMCTIIGLSLEDILQLISQKLLPVEITNQNAPHSFVVSGAREGIVQLIDLAKEEGALHTRDLGVSVPYHSPVLQEGAMDFAQQISHLNFSTPLNRIISLVDQKILTSRESMREEVIQNLYHELNWYTTQRIMLEQGITLFVECGPSSGLVKNARFIDGNYRFQSLDTLFRK